MIPSFKSARQGTTSSTSSASSPLGYFPDVETLRRTLWYFGDMWRSGGRRGADGWEEKHKHTGNLFLDVEL